MDAGSFLQCTRSQAACDPRAREAADDVHIAHSALLREPLPLSKLLALFLVPPRAAIAELS